MPLELGVDSADMPGLAISRFGIVMNLLLFDLWLGEIGIRILDVSFLDPDVAVTYVVPFALKFQPTGTISDA